jgi:hypothetical protein
VTARRRPASELSHGGRYYRANVGRERRRKADDRGRQASAAVGFIEMHAEFSGRWHPVAVHIDKNPDKGILYCRLTRKEEHDWRAFLRENRWEVGEKGRDARIRECLPPSRTVRPLNPGLEEARRRFHEEALGRSRDTYDPIYHPQR